MNSINLTGRLARDPELRELDEEKAVAKLRLAVDNGKYDATFINVAQFGPAAQACAKHLSKGSPVAVIGRLSHNEWQTEDGEKRSTYEVIAQRVEFLPNGKRQDEQDS